MERSILQDNKPVSGAEIVRRRAAAPAAINMARLSDEYEERKSLEQTALAPLYSESGVLDYLNDAWHSFNESRLATSIDEERGKLAREVKPRQRDVNYQLQHLESKQAFENLDKQLSETPITAEGYTDLLNERNKAYDAYVNTSKGYDEIVAANGKKDINSLLKEKEDLDDKEKGFLENIADYRESLKENEEYQISADYKRKEQEAMEKGAPLTDLQTWTHGMPSTMGSSATSWKTQALNAAYNLGVFALGAAGIVAAPFSGGTSLAGTAAAAALYTGGVAMSVGTNLYSRREESSAEVFDAKRSKVLDELNKKGANESYLATIARETASKNGQDLSDYSDKELTDMVISGEISVESPTVNGILKQSEAGLQDLYERNLTLSASDIAQDVITFVPIAKGVKMLSDATIGKAAKAAGKLVDKSEKLSKAAKKMKEMPDAVRKFNNRMIDTAGKVRAAGAIKTAGVISLDAVMEGFEEGTQQVFQEKYASGDKDNSMIANALSVIPAYGEVAAIVSGIDTKSKLANDPEFYTNFNSGVALGLLMGGPMVAGQQIVQTNKEASAMNYANNVIATQIADKDAFNKAGVYVNKTVNNKQQEVLATMEAMKDRLPEGVTAEDMDEEIAHATRVMGMANNPNNRKLAKDLEISEKSPKYASLIGLQDYHFNKVKELSTSNQELDKTFKTALNEAIKPITATVSEGSSTFAKDAASLLNSKLAQSDAQLQFAIDNIELIKSNLTESPTSNELKKALDDEIKRLNEQKINEVGEEDKKVSLNKSKTYKSTYNDLMNNADLMTTYQALVLNNAALDYHANALDAVSPGEVDDEKKNKIDDLLNGIDEGRAKTFDLIKDNMKDHNDKAEAARQKINDNIAADNAKSKEGTPTEKQNVVDNVVDKQKTEEATAKETKEEQPKEEVKKPVTPTEEKKAVPKKSKASEVELFEPEQDLLEDEEVEFYDEETGEIKKATKDKPKDTKKDKPTTPTVEGIRDSDLDDDFVIVDEDDVTGDGMQAPSEAPTNTPTIVTPTTGSRGSEKQINDKIKTLESVAEMLNKASSDSDNGELSQIQKMTMDVIVSSFEAGKYDKLFDLWSNVMFFNPSATTPMDITVNGKKLDVQPGAELKKVTSDPKFIQKSTFEYVVGDGDKSVGSAGIYVIINYDGKKYAAAFRTPGSAEKIAASRIAFFASRLDPANVAQNEATINLLTELYKRSIDSLISNRQQLLFLWNGKGDNERLVPANVTRSDGAISKNEVNGIGVRRPIQNIKGLLPENVTRDNTDIGISAGIFDRFRIENISDHTIMNGLGGQGDVFVQVKTPSGNEVAIMVDKQKIGAFKGFSSQIFDMLKSYYNNYIQIDGKRYNLQPFDFLTTYVGFGPHTRPTEKKPAVNPEKQFAIEEGVLILGTEQYNLSDIDAHRAEIEKYINENINIRVAKDLVWSKVSAALPLHELFLGTDATNIAIGPFKFSKTMLDENDKTTYFDTLLSANALVSDVADNIFTLPFMRTHGVNTVLGTEAKKPEPAKAAPIASTPTPSQEAVADLSLDEVDVAANDIGTSEVTEDVQKLIDSGKVYNPFEDLDDVLPGANKIAKESKNKVTNKEIQWLRSSVGLTEGELQVYDTWLAGVKSGGMQAMGNMRHDCITISKMANRGVAYHEGFHRVSLLLLTDKERTNYYGIMAKRLGITQDTLLEQKAIEEALADDFAEFATKPYRHLLYPITKFFRRILRYIKIFGNKSDNQLSDLYNEILNGKFKTHEVDKASLDRFKKIYTNEGAWFRVGEEEFKHISLKDYRETINSLVAATFKVNSVELISDSGKLSLGNIKTFLSPEVTNKLNLTDAQKLARIELFEKFDSVIQPELKYQLAKYTIKLIDKESDEDSNNSETGDAARSDLSAHTKSNVEVSWRDNALASAKLFIATIPSYDADNKLIVNAATGLPTFVDFKKSWNKTLNELHDKSTINDLLVASSELGKSDAFFKAFNQKLAKVESEYVRTQLLNTISTAYHHMVEVNAVVTENEDGTSARRLFVNDANLKRATRELPILWNGVFLENFFEYSGELRTITLSKLKDISDGFKVMSELKAGKDKRAFLVGLLNNIGIGIDSNTLDSYVREVTNIADADKALEKALTYKDGVSSIFNTLSDINLSVMSGNIPQYKGKPVNYPTLLTRMKVVSDLAAVYARLNPNSSELSVIGPENTLLYPISSHNYLSQTTQRLNQDLSFIRAMSEVVYNMGNIGKDKQNKGSKILSYLLENRKNKIQFNTLVSFRVDKTGDGGRKYSEINDKEDYVTNLALSENGHLILPTMGDSTTRNTISGVPMFTGMGEFDYDANNNVVYRFNSEVTAQMWQYFKAEFNTILNNYNNEAILDKHPERKVANYHKGTRNGYRFRYFGQLIFNGKMDDLDHRLMMAEKKDGDNKERPATRALLNRIQEMIRLNESSAKYHDMMNDWLNSALNNELKYANSIGVIEYSGNLLTAKNKALDQQTIAEKAKEYKGSDSLKISKATVDSIARYLANSVMSNIEFEKIYTKDPAYYKWKISKDDRFTDKTVDKIKRVREVLSTGVIPRTDLQSEGKDSDTTFKVATFNDVKTSAKSFETIKNLANRSFGINLLREMHELTDEEAIKIYDNKELFDSKEYSDVRDALAARKDHFNGYADGNVNQTDATVLIAPEFYKQLVKRVDGWNDTLEKAYKILTDPTNAWMDNLEANENAMALILKPLKFMYFGDHFDAELGLNVPVFDKMAMFPVFPAFVHGSDAQNIYDLMTNKNKPIDMIAFDSAVKVGMKSSTDVYGKSEAGETIINPTLGDINVYTQQYENLKRQLITDPHHAERQMFVSQAFKAAMGNIREDRIYKLPQTGKEVTGTELRNLLKQSFDALTRKGFERIASKFGITETSEGYSVDKDRLYKALWENARNSDMNVNVLEGLSEHLPLSALSDNNWIESSLSSTFNREIIDTRLPGGMFIQMSSILWNNVTSDKTMQRRLNEVNADGSMDCVISLNLLKHILPKGQKFTFKEARKWLVDNKVIGNTDDVKPISLGYRIPAQGPASLSALRVVDIYPEQIGDTITLPDAFTSKTGSDFD